jgi:hypothetical protein
MKHSPDKRVLEAAKDFGQETRHSSRLALQRGDLNSVNPFICFQPDARMFDSFPGRGELRLSFNPPLTLKEGDLYV